MGDLLNSTTLLWERDSKLAPSYVYLVINVMKTIFSMRKYFCWDLSSPWESQPMLNWLSRGYAKLVLKRKMCGQVQLHEPCTKVSLFDLMAILELFVAKKVDFIVLNLFGWYALETFVIIISTRILCRNY